MGLPFQPNQIGTIVQWDAVKGYGFLDTGSDRVFIHWRDFRAPRTRPELGDRVEFSMGLDEKGRPCAKEALIHRTEAKITPPRRGSSGLLVIFIAWPLLLFCPIRAALAHGFVPAHLAGYGVILNAITYLIYRADKRAAQTDQWRIPEKIMHLLELMGGWPGALLAQRRYRHKTVKSNYQFWFWAIIVAYQFVAVDSLRGWQWSKAILRSADRNPPHQRVQPEPWHGR